MNGKETRRERKDKEMKVYTSGYGVWKDEWVKIYIVNQVLFLAEVENKQYLSVLAIYSKTLAVRIKQKKDYLSITLSLS